MSNDNVKKEYCINYLQLFYREVYFNNGSQDQFCQQNIQCIAKNFI